MHHSKTLKSGSDLWLNYGSLSMSGTVSLIARLVESHPNRKQIEDVFGGRSKYLDLLQACARIDEGVNARAHKLADLTPENLLQADVNWNNGKRPSLPAVAREWLRDFNISERSREGLLVLLTCMRAEMVKGMVPTGSTREEIVGLQSNEAKYHNRVHSMMVFQIACVLSSSEPRLLKIVPRLVATITGAAGHDLDHPGMGNQGVFYKNEDYSYQFIGKLVDALYSDNAMAKWMKDRIKTELRFTDASGPHVDLHKAIEKRDAGITDWAQCELKDKFLGKAAVYPNYKPSSSFWIGAGVVGASDILFSCSSQEAFLRGARRLTEEARDVGLTIDFSTPDSQDFFLKSIYRGKYPCASACRLTASHTTNLTPPQHT